MYVKNKDNAHCEGCDVSEVNGKDAEEIPAFEPTRGELKLLAAHYIKQDLEYSYIWFLYQQTGSDWIRLQTFAKRRVARIASLIGEKTVNSIEEKLFMEIIHPQDRDIFLNGTDEELKRVREQAWAAINNDRPAAIIPLYNTFEMKAFAKD